MRAADYQDLLKALQKLEKQVFSDAQRRGSQWAPERWEALHADAEVGGSLKDFKKVLCGRTAVHFLLRTVFVRVLEDLRFIPSTLRGLTRFQAFQGVAPSLGYRSFFEWVFRDLAHDFPDVFGERPDDLGPPSEDLCRAVWDLWRQPGDAGGLRWDWSEDPEGFDSRFLGDLYQELDQDVRKRFALLQTPDFVESYILDHTLTPALEVFDPERLVREGQTFRIIDPTCGSGHFLIGAFHRLADYWEGRGRDRWMAAQAALRSVWGCDINPHAVYIARFRLMLEVMTRTGVRDLDRLASLTMNLAVMDSLVPWERREDDAAPGRERLERYGTPHQRAQNALFLSHDFHAVVGNPPYITPKDPKKRDDYRLFWPESAAGKYGLAAPFVERLFDLGARGAFQGQITGNAFIKRSFGISLVEKVLPRWDLTDIVDTSGAYIPGHGTPTVILFGRCQPPASDHLRVLGGKRGEPKAPDDPTHGKVWSAITQAAATPTDEDSFVTVSRYPRDMFNGHPWNVNGGGAPELQRVVQQAGSPLAPDSAGIVSFTLTDDVYLNPPDVMARWGLSGPWMVTGTEVRDFAHHPSSSVVFPYDDGYLPTLEASEERFLWPFRAVLGSARMFGSKTKVQAGLAWYEFGRLTASKLKSPYTVVQAFVATHNHFVLDRGGKVFKQTAPVIKLAADASLDDHLDLLGLLNSSTLGFWMKQVFFDKGFTGGGAFRGDDWEVFFEYDSTKLKRAPITQRDRRPRLALATSLDRLASKRAETLPAALFADENWTADTLQDRLAEGQQRYHSLTRELVAHQEELDWLTYQSYGLLEDVDVTLEPEPLAPGHRPFEIVLARHNASCDPDERSAWFTRHGHAETTSIPTRYSDDTRRRIQDRLDLIAEHAPIRLIEQPQFKRRWQLVDYGQEAQIAARDWLLDRLEALFMDSGPLADPRPWSLDDVVNALRDDPRIAAAVEVRVGTANFDLSRQVEVLLVGNAIPDNPLRVYTASGLAKWRAWQHTWALQDREDAGETVDVEVPPSFARGDFQRAEYFKLRGKLNVPRERFILFEDLTPPRYGWNGWRDEARALAQVEAYTQAESDPTQSLPMPSMEDPRRCGPTIGLWEALPDLKRWGDEDTYDELSSLPAEACGRERCPCDVSQAWLQWQRGELDIAGVARPDPNAATLAEKAALLSLLETHQPKVQTELDGSERPVGGLSQTDLKNAWKLEGHPPKRFKRVVDELLASGDIANLGRGKTGGLRTAG